MHNTKRRDAVGRNPEWEYSINETVSLGRLSWGHQMGSKLQQRKYQKPGSVWLHPKRAYPVVIFLLSLPLIGTTGRHGIQTIIFFCRNTDIIFKKAIYTSERDRVTVSLLL